ncbi:MAG: tRNA lysidine(34) synthetase TilS [Rhodospirillales bacterium]|nr:tRNA lysidine(34) synthetase TilS [Rhodospirillales bacterium]MCY4002726.1 tRNA lysidine(34) synthetase TilS [Rhodospirillales bacterium]MDE0372109.1 tRNA lysidine(34) synthetase TilS [Rhodospirillales bacterium]MXX21688.1 tRNA lysidine(34) synthetase TilS [Rhodospirillales bacterium]MYE18744.1 tRNA lysidine(34) synthetase TilS [Rhodospirillales bacterium]
MTTASTPVTPAEFRRLAAEAGLSHDRCSSLAIGVSGGTDSMALANLLAEWAGGRRGSITALTVDHRLRQESTSEAATVSRWIQDMGMQHEILVWHHGNITRGIQAAARAARFRLMGAWCMRVGVANLLLAHHLEDQAETFLMRLAAGSGIAGLGCMRVRAPMATVELVRPLLGIPKSRLRATLARSGGNFVEDPSNQDLRYTRTRLRRLLLHPASDLPKPATLARATRTFRRLDALAERATAARLRDSMQVSPLGFVTIDLGPFTALPDLLALRCIAAVMQAVAGRDYPPRTRSLRRVLERIHNQELCTSTLGGTVLSVTARRLAFTREVRAVSNPARLRSPKLLWDNRFQIETDFPADDLIVGALGTQDLRKLPVPLPGPAVRRDHLATLPAFRDLDGLVAVPHLNWWRDNRLRTRIRVVFEPRSGLLAAVSSLPGNRDGTGRNTGCRGHA